MFFMTAAIILLINFACAQATFDGLQSGRYEIHKNQKSVSTDKSSVKKIASRKPASSPVLSPQQVLLATATPTTVALNETKPVAAIEILEKPEPSLADQVESLAGGDTKTIFNFYQEQAHPDDIRNNRVEIEVGPYLVQNDSKSNYSFREYSGFFPAAGIQTSFWLTPLIGISGKYIFSLAADTPADPVTRSRDAVNHEFLDLSINLRKFVSLSRLSNSAELNLLYTDYKMNVPASSLFRSEVNTSGAGLGFKTRVPTSADYAWTFGAQFFPKLKQSEGGSALDLSSGTNPNVVRIGVNVGGEYKFQRQGQVVWSLGATSEKTVYGGSANKVDPTSSQTPDNVSVTNTMLIFNLGYRWGQ